MIEIYDVAKLELQNPNLWEFYLQHQPEMKIRVQSTTLPFFGFETVTQLEDKHYSKLEPIEDITVTFLETTDFKTLDFLEEWMNIIYDFEKRHFKTITDVIYNKYNSAILVFQGMEKENLEGKQYYLKNYIYNRAYLLTGIKIKKIENYSLDYNQSDPLIITVNFSVDNVELYPVESIPTSGTIVNLLTL